MSKRKKRRVNRKIDKSIGKALFGWRWRKYVRETNNKKQPTSIETLDKYAYMELKKAQEQLRSNFLLFLEEKNKEEAERGNKKGV